jgi:hypothetical protein
MVFIFPWSSRISSCLDERCGHDEAHTSLLARLDMPEGKTDHIEFDETMPGFGVRIRGKKGEHRTFIAQYKIGTRHRRINLGNVAKVKTLAGRPRLSLPLGRTPPLTKQPPKPRPPERWMPSLRDI